MKTTNWKIPKALRMLGLAKVAGYPEGVTPRMIERERRLAHYSPTDETLARQSQQRKGRTWVAEGGKVMLGPNSYGGDPKQPPGAPPQPAGGWQQALGKAINVAADPVGAALNTGPGKVLGRAAKREFGSPNTFLDRVGKITAAGYSPADQERLVNEGFSHLKATNPEGAANVQGMLGGKKGLAGFQRAVTARTALHESGAPTKTVGDYTSKGAPTSVAELRKRFDSYGLGDTLGKSQFSYGGQSGADRLAGYKRQLTRLEGMGDKGAKNWRAGYLYNRMNQDMLRHKWQEAEKAGNKDQAAQYRKQYSGFVGQRKPQPVVAGGKPVQNVTVGTQDAVTKAQPFVPSMKDEGGKPQNKIVTLKPKSEDEAFKFTPAAKGAPVARQAARQVAQPAVVQAYKPSKIQAGLSTLKRAKGPAVKPITGVRLPKGGVTRALGMNKRTFNAPAPMQ